MQNHYAGRPPATGTAVWKPRRDLATAIALAADPMVDPLSVPLLRAAMHGASNDARGQGRCLVLPLDTLGIAQRDLIVATSTMGGYSAGNPTAFHTNAPRAASVTGEAGVIVQPIASDALGIPYVSGTSTAGWVSAENGNLATSEQTFGLRQTAAKTLGFVVQVSRKLLKMGGPQASALIVQQMSDDLGRGVDVGVLAGSGSSGQISGVGTVSGTVSLSGSSLSYATILDGVRQVLAAGARLAELRFVVGSQAWETLSAREKAAGSGFIIENGAINGIPVLVSTDAAADSLFLGPWARITLYTWGGVELFTNPYVSPATGAVQVRVMLDCDLVIPHPGLFLKSTSVT